MDILALINENLDLILLIGSIIASFFVIKLVTKILFRLIILLLIITTCLVVYQKFSNTNIIDDIKQLYCEGEKLDPIKCNCFVNPIINDLNTRFNEEELEVLKTKKLKANTEFLKSYKIKEDEIKNCFQTMGNSSGILEEIFNDIKKSGLKIIE
tara:strand:- start:135 stop:596 length:462 start_codon:yes stop_codon:yes gene_type:complete